MDVLHERELQARLEQRLGVVHARQRLGIESDHEAQVFGGGFSFFHLENWYSAHSLIKNTLKVTGLYNRAARNALNIELVENHVRIPALPAVFKGLRILHLSDLHLDMSEQITHAIIECVREAEYDLCVWTGDYRYRTYGSFEQVLQSARNLRGNLSGPVYAVLGNHDSVKMVPEFEDAEIRMLMNESVVIARDGESLHLAGIDDAHFFGVGNIEKALAAVPDGAPAILLSHTPEVYRLAAHAGIALLLCGHTHGGQICLPGGIPLTLDARIPRHLGRGSWQFGAMHGYTSRGAGSSVVDARLNCRPEVTVHELHGPQ
jgi:predicted MPP superfamily phosphohydrolase